MVLLYNGGTMPRNDPQDRDANPVDPAGARDDASAYDPPAGLEEDRP